MEVIDGLIFSTKTSIYLSEMVEKAVEPEHFVYIVLSREEPEREYGYRKDFDYLEEAKNSQSQLVHPQKSSGLGKRPS